ncbi:uncharacterized protein LOC134088850 isoform X2 [Sardina pilchardus]|uniref:uncharacterized protein LOC134088850 isoform X2 n=1 Tax=Sardina pilchardus TaxID=27697 RepID=UPI002E11E04A
MQEKTRSFLIFAGGIVAVYTQDFKDISARLGGEATLSIPGANSSQCMTAGELIVECNNGKMEEGAAFFGRISGSCNSIKLLGVRSEDGQHPIICQDLDSQNPSVHSYKIIISTANPITLQNVPGPTVASETPSVNLTTKPIQVSTANPITPQNVPVTGPTVSSETPSANLTTNPTSNDNTTGIIIGSVVAGVVGVVGVAALIFFMKKRDSARRQRQDPQELEDLNGHTRVNVGSADETEDHLATSALYNGNNVTGPNLHHTNSSN